MSFSKKTSNGNARTPVLTGLGFDGTVVAIRAAVGESGDRNYIATALQKAAESVFNLITRFPYPVARCSPRRAPSSDAPYTRCEIQPYKCLSGETLFGGGESFSAGTAISSAPRK